MCRPLAASRLETVKGRGEPVRHLDGAVLGCERQGCSSASYFGDGRPQTIVCAERGGYLPVYDTGRGHIARAPQVLPNEPPSLAFLLESVKHAEAVQMRHLLIDELYMRGTLSIGPDPGIKARNPAASQNSHGDCS